MNDLAALLFVSVGTAFTVLAAIGLVRMPDLFMRMQTATKASTLGVACVMAGTAAYFADLGTAARAALIIAFLFLTAPVAAHAIGRAAYLFGVRLWEHTIVDELGDRYDDRTHRLRSRPASGERHEPRPETPVGTQ